MRLKQQQQNIKLPKETQWHESISQIQGGAQDDNDKESKEEKDEKISMVHQTFLRE